MNNLKLIITLLRRRSFLNDDPKKYYRCFLGPLLDEYQRYYLRDIQLTDPLFQRDGSEGLAEDLVLHIAGLEKLGSKV